MGRDQSDEAYVLDLCDEALGEEGLRQHRFDWLLGDPGRTGHRSRLPVDAYWPDHGLVVEYRELQHDRPNAFFDKPDRLTVSGVHRGRQRALYDARRDTLIPQHGLRLTVIRPADLSADVRGRLRRHPETDLAAVRTLLAPIASVEAAPAPPGDGTPVPVPAPLRTRTAQAATAAGHTEDRVTEAFRAWLVLQGWTPVTPADAHTDVEAVRGAERLIGEVKGRTRAPGTDLDTAYGQLLRRMTESDPAVQYAIVVPASVLSHARRVPSAVRRLLRIDLYAVSPDGGVEQVRE
ncbi:hypothetical protein LO771_21300 [Streptacidiphilus sp. ASG 303]|uniref:hypothetical protein n=1 Tax=Streptacidiphilus sp. ASG 303 TaxID=2896847 RepID=UPI001E46E1D9|nr:hypothetical protein [Streptacidiphilus sp. ASG 303]MCD0484857.1 hypothetical protein [Streptacidiphilus sp. ASG 303]